MTESRTLSSELIGLTPRESRVASPSFTSASFDLPARATSRILADRLSKLAWLRFRSESRSAAPPRKLRLFSFGLSPSETDFPREKRFLSHPLTLEVGEVADSSDFRLSVVSVCTAGMAVVGAPVTVSSRSSLSVS